MMSTLPEGRFMLVKKPQGIAVVKLHAMDSNTATKTIRDAINTYGRDNVIVADPVFMRVETTVTVG